MSEDPIWKATQRELAKKNIAPVAEKFEDAPKASSPTTDDFLRGFNEDDEIKSTPVKREPSFWDLTINSFNRGYNNAALGQEAWKSMYGRENELDKYNQILSSDEYSFETDDWWEMLISGAAQQFGQWGRQMTDPDTLALAAGASGAAFLAGQAGPQVLAPEELFTVPAAFAAGLTAGNAKTALEVEGGLAYLEMLDNGVSEETARTIATGVGTVNAGLEFLQLDELLKAYKVLDKAGADDSFLKIVIRELTDRGVDIATETGQELLQETTTIAGTQLGSKLDTGEWAYNFGDVTDRLRNTAKESAMTFGLTNIPSTVYNIDTQNRNRLAAQGEARLRTGEMPTDEQLSAMNMSKPEALGAMVMLSLDQFDDAADGYQTETMERNTSAGNTETVTYRRVQGGAGDQSSQQRVMIDNEGKVYINNKTSNLSLSVDNGEHSQYYVENRRPGADIYAFEVPRWFDDIVQEFTLPQAEYRNNPLNQGRSAPKLTDPRTPGKCIEFPAPWIEWIEEYATNGRIIRGGR